MKEKTNCWNFEEYQLKELIYIYYNDEDWKMKSWNKACQSGPYGCVLCFSSELIFLSICLGIFLD